VRFLSIVSAKEELDGRRYTTRRRRKRCASAASADEGSMFFLPKMQPSVAAQKVDMNPSTTH
jgi:hypothetical protein